MDQGPRPHWEFISVTVRSFGLGLRWLDSFRPVAGALNRSPWVGRDRPESVARDRGERNHGTSVDEEEGFDSPSRVDFMGQRIA